MSNTTANDLEDFPVLFLGLWSALAAVIGIPANFLVIFLTFSKAEILKLPLNLLAVSIAVADTFFLVCSVSNLHFWLYRNESICRVGGFGTYIFGIINIVMTPCLSCSRYATVCKTDYFSRRFQFLTKKKGILLLITVIYLCQTAFYSPYIIFKKLGRDPLGLCGIMELNNQLFTIYYLACSTFAAMGSFTLTMFMYRKLAKWVQVLFGYCSQIRL